jgi:AGCS family alanine or glycine:cation symporter
MVCFIEFFDRILNPLLIFVLISGGVFFTIQSNFAQFRHFSKGFQLLWRRQAHSTEGVSAWQSFCVASAARVGTGNIAGVAVALTLGGPGAIFWMWFFAVLNMPTAIVESTLAQLYQKKIGGTLRGGPAYYIKDGLGKPWLGALFSMMLIASFGMTFMAAQSNTIASALEMQFGWEPLWVGLVLVCVVGLVIYQNIQKMARVAAMVVPAMACLYILIALFIIVGHFSELGSVLKLVVQSAFGLQETAAGVAGYTMGLAMNQGASRGLFSNEAGMGSSANISASVDMQGRNPVEQGLIQMAGVVVDTLIICSATAFILLFCNDFSVPQSASGIALVQQSMTSYFGSWGGMIMTLIMTLFCFSTILGNYIYSESNFYFLCSNSKYLILLKLIVLVMIFLGAMLDLGVVWKLAAITSSLMALINMGAIFRLSKESQACLDAFDQAHKEARLIKKSMS